MFGHEFLYRANDPGRIACHDDTRRHIFGHYRPCSDDGPRTDLHTAKHDGVHANEALIVNNRAPLQRHPIEKIRPPQLGKKQRGRRVVTEDSTIGQHTIVPNLYGVPIRQQRAMDITVFTDTNPGATIMRDRPFHFLARAISS